MQCTVEHLVDENGVWTDREAGAHITNTLVCRDCGARHDYDGIHESGDHYTVALTVNSDPEPVATVAIAFRGGVVDTIGGDRSVGLLVIDEDRQEIGRFITRPEDSEWWARVQTLSSRIPKGKYHTSFKEVEGGETSD
jgi:hypothetical protein